VFHGEGTSHDEDFLRGVLFCRSTRANYQTTLTNLAETTGGFLIANNNDLRGPVRKLAEDI
jgi:hypothetical protein